MTDPSIWEIRIAMATDEVEAVRVAMLAVYPWEKWGVRIPYIEDDSAPTLLIQINAPAQAEAEAEAIDIYTQARQQAGLPPAPTLVLGALPPMFATAGHERLLAEAEGHIETGRNEWAVVRAQTACETYAAKALDHLAGHLSGSGDGHRRFRRVTLVDAGDQALLQALTGKAIATEPWWESFRAHVQRRNDVVHAGLVVSEDEARASLGAAESFIEFMQQLWAGRSRRA